MTDSTLSASHLEAAAGAAGPHTVDAFKLLSDEIRLAILLALWEAYDPQDEDNTVAFSELLDHVGMEDSGNFTYHLSKLVGHFIEETDDGYRLRNSGLKIVRAVIAGTGLEERRLPPSEIPRACYHCGAPVELSYEDERLYQICTECEGNIGPESTEQAPVGTLIVYDDFNPAGLTHRTPGEVFVASSIEYIHGVKILIRGVCPECSGPIEESVQVCETHAASSGELCSNCGTAVHDGGGNEVRVSYVCSVCKHSASYPAWTAVFDHPAIVGFYHDHGFDMTYGLDDPEVCGRLFDRLRREQSLVSTDPLRVGVTVSCNGREMDLTLDENLRVIDIARDDGSEDRDPTDDVNMSGPIADSHSAAVTDEESPTGVALPETEECLRELRRHRWPDEITCPHCDSPDTIKKGSTSKDAQRYKCHSCSRKFNDLTGTLFAGHRLSLPEMFHIIREMDETETAKIARRLGRSYKSVLEFVHETRELRNRTIESTEIAAAS